MRLVFLPLLNRAVGRLEILRCRKALHRLTLQIAIGHGVADDGDRESVPLEQGRKPARHLRLAAARPDGTYCNHRHFRAQHGSLRTQKREVGAGRKGNRSMMQHGSVGHVAVGENDVRYPLVPAQQGQFLLSDDRDAVGIARTGQSGRIVSTGNAGYLCGGKGDDLAVGVVFVDNVEIMKVAAGCAHNHDPRTGFRLRHCRRLRGVVARTGRSFFSPLPGSALDDDTPRGIE